MPGHKQSNPTVPGPAHIDPENGHARGQFNVNNLKLKTEQIKLSCINVCGLMKKLLFQECQNLITEYDILVCIESEMTSCSTCPWCAGATVI